jgi:hypothetical protein
VSIGVLFQGSAPNADSATQAKITTNATGGAAGPGGKPGTNDGKAGVVAPIKDVAQL